MSLSRSEQSRINGAKSKGPKTLEGKRISSMNSLDHGLCADKVVVLRNELPATFDKFYAAFVEKFQPQDDVERELILQAVFARWRLRRIWQLETSLFDIQMDRQRGQIEKTFATYDEGTRQAVAFESLVNEKNSFTALSRYETRISREYDRAIRALYLARAERSNPPQQIFPSEPGEQSQPVLPDEPAALPHQILPNEPGETPGASEPEPPPQLKTPLPDLGNPAIHASNKFKSPVFSSKPLAACPELQTPDAKKESACRQELHIAPSLNSMRSLHDRP